MRGREVVRKARGCVKRAGGASNSPLEAGAGFAPEGHYPSYMSAGDAIPHFIRLQDLSDRQVEDILDLSSRLKRGVSRADLAGRTVGLRFVRGSLRTRPSLDER